MLRKRVLMSRPPLCEFTIFIDSLTVQAYREADRLDLFRVGILPDRYSLGTPAARDAALIRMPIARRSGMPVHEIADDWGL